MTELSFLIDLLLNHDLTKTTKDAVANRIKEVEQMLTHTKISVPAINPLQVSPKMQQVASTMAAMARHGEVPAFPQFPVMPENAVVPVEAIAQNPATAAALAARSQAINDAIAGKTDKAAGKPRKW